MRTHRTLLVALALAGTALAGCKVEPGANIYHPATAPDGLTPPPAGMDLRVVSSGYSRGRDLHTVTCAPAGETFRSAETVWEYQVPEEGAYSWRMGDPCPTDQPLVSKF